MPKTEVIFRNKEGCILNKEIYIQVCIYHETELIPGLIFQTSTFTYFLYIKNNKLLKSQ